MDRKASTAWFLALLSLPLWSASPLFVRLLPGVDPLVIAGLRGGFAAPLIFVWAMLLPGKSESSSRREEVRLTTRWFRIAVVALFYGIAGVTYVGCLQHVTALAAATLFYAVSPITSLAAHFITGKRAAAHDVIAIAATALFLPLFSFDQISLGQAVWVGVGAFSGFSLGLSGFVSEPLSSFQRRIAFTLGSAMLPIAMLLVHRSIPQLDRHAWLVLAAFGSIGLAVPMILWSGSIELGGSLVPFVTLTMQPVVASLLVWATLGEIPGPWAIFAGAVILSGCIWHGIVTARMRGRK